MFEEVSTPGDLAPEGPLSSAAQGKLRELTGMEPTVDNRVRLLVDVCILFPHTNNPRVVGLAVEHALGPLLAAGVRAWRWEGPPDPRQDDRGGPSVVVGGLKQPRPLEPEEASPNYS